MSKKFISSMALVAILSGSAIPTYANAAELNPTAIEQKVDLETNSISDYNINIDKDSNKINIEQNKSIEMKTIENDQQEGIQTYSLSDVVKAGKDFIRNSWNKFATQAIRRISDIGNFSFNLRLDLHIDNYTVEAKKEYVGTGYHTSGQLVSKVQRLLKERGYSVTVDGIWGSKTKSAVQSLQKAKGLSADGIVGPATWDALVQQ